MKFYPLFSILLLLVCVQLKAQDKNIVHTDGNVTIDGKLISYKATTGLLDIHDDEDSLVAKVFFIYYKKKDVPNIDKRPILFAYNGGPGSSSVWLHMGLMGPKIIDVNEKGEPFSPPYSYSNNAYSWLDYVDLVFIDPMYTGYTYPINEKLGKAFTGYENDIKLVSKFIRTFTSQYKRWGSPKYLAGESYGTVRSAGVAEYLQKTYGMYLNGIFLISAILNFETVITHKGNDLPYPLMLPTFAATSWYHGKVPQYQSVDSLIHDVKTFATTDYALALLKGDKLDANTKKDIVQKLHLFTGISPNYIEDVHLRLTVGRFNKELLRKSGLTVGRLDTRFLGTDYDNAGEVYETDPSYTNVIYGIFSTTFKTYLSKELKYTRNMPYEILTSKVQPWKYSEDKYLNVSEHLRKAMTYNPNLKVFIASGYYDMATPFFATDYVIDHMFLKKNIKKNIVTRYYPAGHMMYIHKPSLIRLRKDFVEFMTTK